MSKIISLNLNRKFCLYDGFEPDDYYQEFQLPDEYSNLSFTLSEIITQPFKNLRNLVDAETYDQLAALQKLKNPNTEWEIFVGDNDLSLYYLIRENKLILISFGEFQPARYICYLESVWEIESP